MKGKSSKAAKNTTRKQTVKFDLGAGLRTSERPRGKYPDNLSPVSGEETPQELRPRRRLRFSYREITPLLGMVEILLFSLLDCAGCSRVSMYATADVPWLAFFYEYSCGGNPFPSETMRSLSLIVRTVEVHSRARGRGEHGAAPILKGQGRHRSRSDSQGN